VADSAAWIFLDRGDLNPLEPRFGPESRRKPGLRCGFEHMEPLSHPGRWQIAAPLLGAVEPGGFRRRHGIGGPLPSPEAAAS